MVFPKRTHQERISQYFRMSSKLEIGPRQLKVLSEEMWRVHCKFDQRFPEDDIKSLVSNATLGVHEVKPPKERRIRNDGDRCMFEFCCSPDSSLGNVN